MLYNFNKGYLKLQKLYKGGLVDLIIKKPRVLDERAISFKISDGLLEVFDQKDFLIGDRPLPIPVEPSMTVDEIYNVATQCNYDIDEMIGSIIQEAVIENEEYDIWLSHEEIIFFSPSTQKWVSEPYDGIFAWLEAILVAEEEPKVEEAEEEVEEVEEIVEEEPEEVEEIEEEQEETSEDEELEEKEEETEEVEEVEDVEAPEDYVEDLDGGEGEENMEIVEGISEEEKAQKLEEWKSAYETVSNSEEEVSGITMEYLMKVATLIIMEEEKDVFAIDEKEVLFKLVTQEKVIFNGIDVLKAAFYNAHLLLNESKDTAEQEDSTEEEEATADDEYG